MAIWQRNISTDILNELNSGSMMGYLGIKFTEVGDDYLCATMPASQKTRQPFGIIHGGANMVLAEGIASTAANMSLVDTNQRAFGLDINANHIRMVQEGIVTAKTYPIHLGRTTHVWQVDISNEDNKLTCVCRMTAMIMTPK